MPSYSGAVLAQCLTCERKDRLKNTAYTICEREGESKYVIPSLTPNSLSWQTCVSGLKCLLFALFSLLPGKVGSKYSCVLSVLAAFNVVYIVLPFFGSYIFGLPMPSRWLLWEVEMAHVIPELHSTSEHCGVRLSLEAVACPPCGCDGTGASG